MLSLFYSNAVLLVVMVLPFAASETVQERISELPVCSGNCIATAATASGCAANDFACLCQKADSILGDGGITSQRECLKEDCGVLDAARARISLNEICDDLEDLLQSTSAISTSSTSQIVVPPTTTSVPPPPPQSTVAQIPDQPSPDLVPVPPPSASTVPPPASASTTSTTQIIQGTTSSTSVISATTTLQTSSAAPPPQTFTIISSSSPILALPVTSQPAAPVTQSTIIKTTTNPSPLAESTTSSAQTTLPLSSSSAISITTPASSVIASNLSPPTFLAAVPTTDPYQAEANQSTATPQMIREQRLATPAIIGIVVGIASLIVVAIFVFLLMRRKKQARKQRAFSSAPSRKSGEEITIFLDLQTGNNDSQRRANARRANEMMERSNLNPTVTANRGSGSESDLSDWLSSHMGRLSKTGAPP